MSLVFEDYCAQCGESQRGERVFQQCRCPRYSAIEESWIRNDFQTYALHLGWVKSARELEINSTARFVSFLTQMNPNAYRMLVYGTRSKAVFIKMTRIIRMIRFMAVESYIRQGGRDMNSFWYLHDMTPRMSAASRYRGECYLFPTCGGLTGTGMCRRHSHLIRALHSLFIMKLPAVLAKKCLDLVFPGYQNYPACLPKIMTLKRRRRDA